MDLAGFAAAVREVAGRAEATLATDCARAAGREYLAVLFTTTPVRTGALRDSERIQSLAGGGTVATALVGPDIVYDKIQNDGGTIHVKHAKVLTDGTTFFGKQVTIKGQHYMEHAEAEALEPIAAAIAAVVDETITL